MADKGRLEMLALTSSPRLWLLPIYILPPRRRSLFRTPILIEAIAERSVACFTSSLLTHRRVSVKT